MMFGAYVLALAALELAEAAPVAALRETSVVMAAVGAAVVGRSRVPATRIAGAVCRRGGGCRDRAGLRRTALGREEGERSSRQDAVALAHGDRERALSRGRARDEVSIAPAEPERALPRESGTAAPSGTLTSLPSAVQSPAATNARAQPAFASTTERARTQVRSRRGGTFSSIRTTSPVAAEPDQVEREAHRERVDGPALRDVQRRRLRHRVELREALQPRGAGVRLGHPEPARGGPGRAGRRGARSQMSDPATPHRG